MKQKDFIFNICLLLFLNLLVKPFWLLGVEVGVQNQVGAADYGLYFAVFNFTYVFYMLLDMGICNYNNRTIARNNLLLDKYLSSIIVLRLILCLVYFAVIYTVALVIGYRGMQLKLLFWIDKPFQIEWFVYCQTAAYLLSIAVALAIVLKKSKLRKLTWNKKLSLLILKKSLPFALLTLLMAFYNRIDSVMIERLLPVDIATTEAGIYASAFRLLDALVMIAYLFSVILLPLFSKMIKDKENIQPIVRTSFSFLYAFAIGATVVLVCYREPILAWLYEDHVEQSASVFALLIPCIIPIAFTYVFGTLLTANGSLKKLNITAMAGIVVNILINIILIPRYQARGAAVASLCTQSVVSLLQFFIAVRELRVPLRSMPWLPCLLFTALMVSATLLSRQYLHLEILYTLLILVAATLLFGLLTRLIDIRALRETITRKS